MGDVATVLEQMNDEMSSIAEGARASLVEVRNGSASFGSGVVCHPDGLIVTNAHVVRSGSPQVRLADGRSFPARVLAVDQERDLAALSIPAGGLSPIQLDRSDGTRPGQWVMSVGHPWEVNGAATAGAVIGSEPGQRRAKDDGWLVASLLLRPGHSDGPMVDAEGRLVWASIR